MSKHEQQPGRVAEFALLFVFIAILIWLTLWIPDPRKSQPIAVTGIICTPGKRCLLPQPRPVAGTRGALK